MGAVTLVLEDGAGRDRSWSLENVSTKATRTLMTELVTAHPERVAFGVFDSADFGSPQSRVAGAADRGPSKANPHAAGNSLRPARVNTRRFRNSRQGTTGRVL